MFKLLRIAHGRMIVSERGPSIEVQAPAKINLFLEVLSRRSDGFHELETVMAPVSVYDSLAFTPRDDGAVVLDCRWRRGAPGPPLPPPESNLVHRTLVQLREAAQCEQGADVSLVKRIPMEAGMGGASSDAAAALLAANRGWKLGWSIEQLAELAASLGSDIPFFLQNGRLAPALCRGRGEKVEPLAGFPSLAIVVVKPPMGLSTAAVFRACTPASAPRDGLALIEAARSSSMQNYFHNRLEEPAFELAPNLQRFKSLLQHARCQAALMTGSGTALFGVFENERRARQAARLIQNRTSAEVFAARTYAGGSAA